MKRKNLVITIISITMVVITVCVLFIRSSTTPKKAFCIKVGNSSINVYLRKNKEDTSTIVSSEYINKEEHLISEWKLNYPVFHFECADMNADGTEDILVGVVKATRYDSISRKRIFIFKLFEGYVRPLWLGSRVSQPLEDFKVIPSQPINLIRTIELEQNGKFLVAEYKWKGFGLTFVQYMVRDVDLTEAQKVFNLTNLNHENS